MGSGVDSAAFDLDGDVAFTTPLTRSFADLRPPAIHFRRSREQPQVRIGTVQLMGVPPATEPSATPGSQLEPGPLSGGTKSMYRHDNQPRITFPCHRQRCFQRTPED